MVVVGTPVSHLANQRGYFQNYFKRESSFFKDRSSLVMHSTNVKCTSEPWPDLSVAGGPKQRNSGASIDRTEMKPRASEKQMPVIDMAILELEDRRGSDCKKMSEYMARACETWGFFQLINHGIDASLLKKVKEVSREFFNEPEEEKLNYKVMPGVIEGYNSSSLTAVGSNKLTHSVDHLYYLTSPASRKTLNRWPLNPPAYRETITEYGVQVQSLAQKLMCILSVELGLDQGTLQNRLAGVVDGELTQSMRTNYYTPLAAEESPNELNLCRLGAHSDPGGLTVLLQNDVAGFQVKKDGLWVDVEAMSNALVVNIGDQIEILSNGIYKSIEHRGNAHRTKERLTVAAFLSPSYEALISPVEELVNGNHPALYKSIKYQDYFSMFVVKGLNGKEHVKAAGAKITNS